MHEGGQNTHLSAFDVETWRWTLFPQILTILHWNTIALTELTSKSLLTTSSRTSFSTILWARSSAATCERIAVSSSFNLKRHHVKIIRNWEQSNASKRPISTIFRHLCLSSLISSTRPGFLVREEDTSAKK